VLELPTDFQGNYQSHQGSALVFEKLAGEETAKLETPLAEREGAT